MKLVFATQNQNKAIEIQKLMPLGIVVQTLKDIECDDDIPETGTTLEANALIKAQYVYAKFGVNCFADDTGLEVESLNGKPGVLSARYAGEGKNAEANMKLVLSELAETKNRSAQFRTVIALILDGNEYIFEGSVQGEITNSKTGTGGFGYDPIFKPTGMNKTFAELSLEEKNTISHRGLAIGKMIEFLSKIKEN